jgi:four helix bundle protein
VGSRVKTYKDLRIWQNAFETSKLLLRLTQKLPRNIQNKIIISQLLRSITSVGANIAEGYGRFGGKEYARFLQVALGSANESDYWLLLLAENNPVYNKEISKIIHKNTESIKMLAASLKTIRNK